MNRADSQSHSDQLSALDTLQNAVDSLSIWMRRNKLKLNEEKTQFMILGSKRSTALCQIDSTQLGTERIPKTEYAVNLGVTIDTELNMSEQISSICRRC